MLHARRGEGQDRRRHALKLDTEKVRSGIYAVNEVRMERDMEPFPDPKYDLPTGAAQGGPPDGSEANPLNMKQLGEGM